MPRIRIPEPNQKQKNMLKEQKLQKQRKKGRMRGYRNGERPRRNSQDVLKKFGYTQANAKIEKVQNTSTLQFYAELLANWIRRGWQKSNIPNHNIPFNKFYYSSNKIYSTDTVKIPYVLNKWKTKSLPIGWLDVIRNDLNKIQNDYNTANETTYNLTVRRSVECNPSPIKQFSSNQTYQNAYNQLRKQYQKNLLDLDSDKISEVQKAQNIGEEMYERLTTYEWLMDLEQDENSSLWETYEYIEVVISGDEGIALNELAEKACDTVISRLNFFGIKAKDLMMIVQSYYDDQSFIGHHRKKNIIRKQFTPEVRESSYISSATTLREGNVSDLVGVPAGVDIFNEKPVFIDFTDNSIAPNYMITGTTGSGKTFLTQTLIVGMLQFPQFYYPIIIDFKNEYRNFAKNLGMQFISLSPSDGIYIDTMVIPKPTGNHKIDMELKEDALRDTEAVFEILLGSAWENLDVRSAFNFVRNSLYHKRGVVLDKPETWKNSNGLTFHSFYDEISKVMQDRPTQAKESAGGTLEPFKKLKQILGDYFEVDGSKTSYFQKPLSLEDVDESTGVVFGLGQNLTSGSNNDERLMLSVRFVMHLLKALTVKMKQQKRLLMTFFEETNQLLLLPHIAGLLSRFASGGRSFGMRNFFITNAPSQIFLSSKLKSKNSNIDLSAISALESNIGGLIVGALHKDDMKVVYNKLLQNRKNVFGFLQLLVNEASSGGNSAMKHTFVLKHRDKTALIQALANPALVEQGLFGSEVKVNSRYNTEIELDDLLEERESKNGLKEYVQDMHQRSHELNNQNKVDVRPNKTVFSEQENSGSVRNLSKQHKIGRNNT